MGGTIEERDGVLYVANPREGLWQGTETRPIRFELEQTFGVEREPRSAILAPIDAVEVDDERNVYVLSSAPSRLVAFDPQGSVRWSSDERGQGPGDLSKPYGLAWDGTSTLYFTNQSGQRLDAWTTSGAFVDSRSLSEIFRYFGRPESFLDNGRRLVLRGAGGENADAAITVVDIETPAQPSAEFLVDVTDHRRDGHGIFASVVVADGLIVVGDYDSYEIRWFEPDGSLARVWTRDFDKLTGTAIHEERGAHTVFSWLYPPLRLDSGRWLACVSWVETDDVDATFARIIEDGEPPVRKNSLDLFDNAGRLLYSLVGDGAVPTIGRPVRVDNAGRLYTVLDDPYPQVRRYAVILDR